nr:hypothetical protein [uncultured Roseateles sp.]
MPNTLIFVTGEGVAFPPVSSALDIELLDFSLDMMELMPVADRWDVALQAIHFALTLQGLHEQAQRYARLVGL